MNRLVVSLTPILVNEACPTWTLSKRFLLVGGESSSVVVRAFAEDTLDVTVIYHADATPGKTEYHSSLVLKNDATKSVQITRTVVTLEMVRGTVPGIVVTLLNRYEIAERLTVAPSSVLTVPLYISSFVKVPEDAFVRLRVDLGHTVVEKTIGASEFGKRCQDGTVRLRDPGVGPDVLVAAIPFTHSQTVSLSGSTSVTDSAELYEEKEGRILTTSQPLSVTTTLVSPIFNVNASVSCINDLIALRSYLDPVDERERSFRFVAYRDHLTNCKRCKTRVSVETITGGLDYDKNIGIIVNGGTFSHPLNSSTSFDLYGKYPSVSLTIRWYTGAYNITTKSFAPSDTLVTRIIEKGVTEEELYVQGSVEGDVELLLTDKTSRLFGVLVSRGLRLTEVSLDETLRLLTNNGGFFVSLKVVGVEKSAETVQRETVKQ